MDEAGLMASPAACHAPAESEPHAGGEVVVAGRRFSVLFVGNSQLFPPQSREKSLAHPPSETNASVSGSDGRGACAAKPPPHPIERVPMKYAG